MGSCYHQTFVDKAGLDLIISNYRPASYLFLSMMVEKITLKQLMKHCQDNNLIPDYQSAYIEGHSCETALIKLYYGVLWAIERQQLTAFNTIDHQVLITVLKAHFGLWNPVLQWFSSYLSHRSCIVRIDSIIFSATR